MRLRRCRQAAVCRRQRRALRQRLFQLCPVVRRLLHHARLRRCDRARHAPERHGAVKPQPRQLRVVARLDHLVRPARAGNVLGQVVDRLRQRQLLVRALLRRQVGAGGGDAAGRRQQRLHRRLLLGQLVLERKHVVQRRLALRSRRGGRAWGKMSTSKPRSTAGVVL
eukprot:364787-Chlamydomonas_euryale.AAC.25